MPSGWRRTLYHILGGLIIPVAFLFLSRMFMLIFVGSLALSFLTVEVGRLRLSTLNRWFFKIYRPLARADEKTRLTGTTYLLIASFVSIWVFQQELAVTALIFLAAGDAFAGLVGRSIGKKNLWGKTLEGDLACFLSNIAAGSVLYFSGLNLPWFTILAGALAAGIIEALPLPINDNLTMPLAAGAVMTLVQAL
jgi:glycerol-3-phosphate acyltransferase PlsY